MGSRFEKILYDLSSHEVKENKLGLGSSINKILSEAKQTTEESLTATMIEDSAIKQTDSIRKNLSKLLETAYILTASESIGKDSTNGIFADFN